MKFMLGVDGGNTKTLALVARDDGVILGTGRAGCGDIYGASSPAAAIAEIENAVNAALREAGIEHDELSAGAFSLAGADWPEDFNLLEDAMRARGHGCVTRRFPGWHRRGRRLWHGCRGRRPASRRAYLA